MMESNIDQEVIDELVAMLEEHIAGGLKKPDAEPTPEAEPVPGVEAATPSEDDEDMKALMELYGKE